ncbi:hypothetical protein KC361_g43 [Hortaea werneckii]|nr:hypothetical protein KC361_g43 [Hortaea werneckii]
MSVGSLTSYFSLQEVRRPSLASISAICERLHDPMALKFLLCPVNSQKYHLSRFCRGTCPIYCWRHSLGHHLGLRYCPRSDGISGIRMSRSGVRGLKEFIMYFWVSCSKAPVSKPKNSSARRTHAD